MSNEVFPLDILGAKVTRREQLSQTRIDTAASGREYRYSWWTQPRYRYRVSFEGLRSDAGSRADLQRLVDFIARHAQQRESFLLADPDDSAVSLHGIGVGDGATTAFQLQRSLLGGVSDKTGGPWRSSSAPRTNLLTWSQDPRQWSQTGVYITAALATAPDGTETARRMTEDQSTGVHYAFQTNSVVVVGKQYCISAYCKAAGRSKVYLDAQNAQGVATFDLAAGAVLTGAGGIASCGNGWYRVWSTFTATGVNSGISFALSTAADGSANSYTGDGMQGVYVWGGQLEEGSTPTALIKTPAAAAVTANPAWWPAYGGGFEPVTDYGSVQLYLRSSALGPRRLLPVARTNVCTTSSGAGWSADDPSGGAYAGVQPDPLGGVTAIYRTEGTSTGIHNAYTTNLSGFNFADRWTGSIYVKRRTGTRNVRLRLQSPGSNGGGAVYDLATGAVVSSTLEDGVVASGIEPCANGWWRLWVTATYRATGANVPLIAVYTYSGTNISYTGDGSSSILLWGAHVEVGDALTDPLATSGATASRTDYTISSSGLVTITPAPAAGDVVLWSGNYYRRVRVEEQSLPLERVVDRMYGGEISLISVAA